MVADGSSLLLEADTYYDRLQKLEFQWWLNGESDERWMSVVEMFKILDKYLVDWKNIPHVTMALQMFHGISRALTDDYDKYRIGVSLKEDENYEIVLRRRSPMAEATASRAV